MTLDEARSLKEALKESNAMFQEEAQMKTAADPTKSTVKSWMKKNVGDHVDPKTDEVNTTSLAESAAQEFDKKDLGGWLDDETHWVWDAAAEVAEAHEKSSKRASVLRSGLIRLAHARPELRPSLLPLLTRKAKTLSGKTAAAGMDDAEFQKLLKKLAKLTDENAHTEALQLLAKSFFSSEKKLVGALDAVKTLHDFFGHIPSGLGKVRDELANGMWSNLKTRLPPEQYAALYGAF